LILYQRLTKFYTICNDFNLTVFGEVSNDNEIAWNLNDNQFIDWKIQL
jgi:hypothetical protein